MARVRERHGGMVGSAIVRCLRDKGYGNIVTRSHAELDLGAAPSTEPRRLSGVQNPRTMPR